jgi:serine/threonine protein phosphatase PrpC
MSHRLATRIGLPAAEERAAGALDLVRFKEPATGAEVRTKGSLFCVAQLTGGDAALARATREALEALERDYYYDMSVGALGALAKALAGANRRLYHQRGKLGIGRRGSVSIVALVVRGREGHVARLGPAAAVILRDDRMFELPPPPPAADDDPRVRARTVALSLGEALEVTPFTWQGELTPGDRIALVSRNLAEVVGNDELRQALAGLRPAAAVEHLQQLFRIRGGTGSDGVLAIEVTELAATATTQRLEAVRPAEPLAGLPDHSPVPLADAIGAGLHRIGDAIDGLQALLAKGLLYGVNIVLAFVPRRRAAYPTSIPRTALREEGRRRRLGLLGMAAVAAMLAVGATVASLPGPSPTDAILRASAARAAIAEAQGLVAEVEERVEGRDLVDRDPQAATQRLSDAQLAITRATDNGVPADALASLQRRVDRGLDAVYTVSRIGEQGTVIDLAATFAEVDPLDMVVASDGSLWVSELARGRLVRIDPTSGEWVVVYRSGQAVGDLVTGQPWLLATAATDVVLIDRQRQAWRFDLVEQQPRPLALAGIEAVSPASHLLAALQHRPPLEIFNLYLVDAAADQVQKWSSGNVIPVTYPGPPEPFLTEAPDLPAGRARDMLVDANLWLLQAGTVTRVNFGTPLVQEDFSLDPPPDAAVRRPLDYRLLDGATVGERELFYVYDAGNARIIAFQRADGAFVRQWLAPRSGELAGMLNEVLALSVASVADGPPSAYLLTPDRVVRVVLE